MLGFFLDNCILTILVTGADPGGWGAVAPQMVVFPNDALPLVQCLRYGSVTLHFLEIFCLVWKSPDKGSLTVSSHHIYHNALVCIHSLLLSHEHFKKDPHPAEIAGLFFLVASPFDLTVYT